MGPLVSANSKRYALNAGVIASFIGAAIMLISVIATYLQHDVVRIRGVVLSAVLIGLALIVRSEEHAYVQVPRRRQ